MAQHDYDIANGTGAAVRTDLNAALAAVLTNNSGASSPTTTQAYMLWADTSAGQLKIRNAANNAWVVIGTLGTANLGLVPASGGSQLNALGSATAPSYAFSGDTNTGVFSPAADVVGIATNGVERVRVNALGHVRASGSSGSFSTGPTDANHEITSGSNATEVLRVYGSGTLFASSVLYVLANRNTTNGTFKAIEYYNISGGNSRFSVADSGLVSSIGSYNATTASAANVFIDTNGAILRSTSSGDYKSDVEPITDEVVNVVLELCPIRYRSLADSDNSAWSYYGLIAEDVAALDPRLCHWGYRDEDYETVEVEEQQYDSDLNELVTVQVPRKQLKADAQLRPEGVQYERVGVLTLAMVQKLNARLTELENRILDLESQ